MKYLALATFLLFIYFLVTKQNSAPTKKDEKYSKLLPEVTNKTKKPPPFEKSIRKSSKVLVNRAKKEEFMPKKLSITHRPSKQNLIQEHVSPQDEEGNIIITSVFLDEGLIIGHGDIILGREFELKEYQNGDKILKLKKPKLWPRGIIPYVISNNHTNTDHINNVIETFHKNSNIRFKKHQGHKNYVVFKSGKKNCYSRVGMIGGMQEIHLAPECEEKEITHEIIHTLGLLHEQNRIDRDEYVKILWENIDKSNHLQFKKISHEFLDIRKFEFDYDSIMLYGSNFFSKYKGDYSMVKIDGLPIDERPTSPSLTDWEKINFFYPKN